MKGRNIQEIIANDGNFTKDEIKALEDAVKRTKDILAWDGEYAFPYEHTFDSCPTLNCRYTTYKPGFKDARAVLFIIPYIDYFKYPSLPTRVSGDQLFVGYTLESPSYYPKITSDEYLQENFNLTAGYSYNKMSDSHLYVPYGPKAYNGSGNYHYKFTFPELTQIPDKRQKSILWMASNCVDNIGRIDIIKQIMVHMKVDSMGQCLPNVETPTDVNDPHGGIQDKSTKKMKLLKEYTFTIAIENSQCDDYATEKVWEALSVGTIPIYLGARNIDQFLPDPRSIINIRDFTSIKDLTDYLKLVETDDNIRRKHLQWIEKRGKFGERFDRFSADGEEGIPMFCNICRKILEVEVFHKSFKPGNNNTFPRCEGIYKIPDNNMEYYKKLVDSKQQPN
eukprot:gene2658-3298_t